MSLSTSRSARDVIWGTFAPMIFGKKNFCKRNGQKLKFFAISPPNLCEVKIYLREMLRKWNFQALQLSPDFWKVGRKFLKFWANDLKRVIINFWRSIWKCCGENRWNPDLWGKFSSFGFPPWIAPLRSTLRGLSANGLQSLHPWCPHQAFPYLAVHLTAVRCRSVLGGLSRSAKYPWRRPGLRFGATKNRDAEIFPTSFFRLNSIFDPN